MFQQSVSRDLSRSVNVVILSEWYISSINDTWLIRQIRSQGDFSIHEYIQIRDMQAVYLTFWPTLLQKEKRRERYGILIVDNYRTCFDFTYPTNMIMLRKTWNHYYHIICKINSEILANYDDRRAFSIPIFIVSSSTNIVCVLRFTISQAYHMS